MPGKTPLETSVEPRPADELDVVVEPEVAPVANDAVSASDIDPLMADTAPPPPGPALATAPEEAVPVPAVARTTSTKRRWWQRIINWDDAPNDGTNGNGRPAPADVGAEANVARWDADPVGPAPASDAVDPLAGWAADTGAAPKNFEDDGAPAAAVEAPASTTRAADPEVVEGPAVAPVGEDPEAVGSVDISTADGDEIDEERWQWTPVPAVDLVPASEREAARLDDRQSEDHDEWDDWAVVVPSTDGTAGSPAAWVAVPLTDLPDGAEPDVLDAPELEPARTGEFPRVPMLAAERARLEPEPQPEPTWLQRRRAHRPRVRRVSRIVRRIDTWTVFKLSLLFWAVAYLILLVAGVLLWSVAISTGTVDNVESFVKDLLALDSFTFDGQKIFRASWVLGAFMAVAGTGLTVTMAVLYNLFADLVGGVRVTVLEEEVVQRPPSRAAR